MNRGDFDMLMNIKLTINPHILYYETSKNFNCIKLLQDFFNIPYTNNPENIKNKNVILLDLPKYQIDIENSIYYKCQRL